MTERPRLTVLPGRSLPTRLQRIETAIQPLSTLAGRIYIELQGFWQGSDRSIPHDWLIQISSDRTVLPVQHACVELIQAGLIVAEDLPLGADIQKHGPNVAYRPHPARPDLIPSRGRV